MANERKLIDADALIKSMREEDLLYPGVPWSTTGVQKQIDKLPTVDAVEVVRCKDCKSSDYSGCSDGMVYCMEHSCYMDENGYCSDGEREVEHG